jgi:hypothetical protein
MALVGGAPVGNGPTYTGAFTANSQSLPFDVSNFGNLVFYCTGTFSTVNVTFEGSVDNGTTWFSVTAVRTNGAAVETATGNLSAAPAYGWELSTNGLTHFRVRTTAFTSGTQTWTLVPGLLATEPNPAVSVIGTVVTSGTVVQTPATLSAIAPITTAASTNASAPKTSAGNLYEVTVSNTSATPVFVKFFNKASAPAPASDAALLLLVIPVAASTTVVYEFGAGGKRFSTGIAVCAVGAIAATDVSNAPVGAIISGSYL